MIDVKVFAYYRISTEMQSIEMQKKSVINFANKKNIKIIEEFDEGIISGADPDRPLLNEMIEKLNEVDGVIIYDWDRLSRDEEFAVRLMYALKNANKKIYESGSGLILDFNEMQNRMIGFFKSMFASEERLKTKQRQMDGIKAYKEKHNGQWGRPKYYGTSTSGVKLTPKRFIQIYKLYRAARISKSGIARLLKMSRNNLYQKLKEV